MSKCLFYHGLLVILVCFQLMMKWCCLDTHRLFVLLFLEITPIKYVLCSKYTALHLPSLCVLQLSSKPAAWSSTPSSSSRASTWGSTTSSTGAMAWPGGGPSSPSAEESSTVSTPRTTRSIINSDSSRGPCSHMVFRGEGEGTGGIFL